MTETPNLHLTKDAPEEYYNVDRVNANSDKIDTFAGSVNSAIAGKQDSISDLSTIRAGAAAGATAVQPADMTSALAGKVSTSEYETDQQRQESEIGAVANAGAKNIVNNTADASRVVASVTWVKNPDGSMSASGTSSGVSAVRVVGVQGSSSYASAVPIPKGKYIVSPSGFELTRFRLALGFFADENSSRQTTNIYNEEAVIEVTTDTARYDLSCVIAQSGETMSGETWRPMIRRAEIKDDAFVPYAPTNRELYEMILALQQNGGV